MSRTKTTQLRKRISEHDIDYGDSSNTLSSASSSVSSEEDDTTETMMDTQIRSLSDFIFDFDHIDSSNTMSSASTSASSEEDDTTETMMDTQIRSPSEHDFDYGDSSNTMSSAYSSASSEEDDNTESTKDTPIRSLSEFIFDFDHIDSSNTVSSESSSASSEEDDTTETMMDTQIRSPSEHDFDYGDSSNTMSSAYLSASSEEDDNTESTKDTQLRKRISEHDIDYGDSSNTVSSESSSASSEEDDTTETMMDTPIRSLSDFIFDFDLIDSSNTVSSASTSASYEEDDTTETMMDTQLRSPPEPIFDLIDSSNTMTFASSSASSEEEDMIKPKFDSKLRIETPIRSKDIYKNLSKSSPESSSASMASGLVQLSDDGRVPRPKVYMRICRKPYLRICHEYRNGLRGCDGTCGALHICLYYIFDTCTDLKCWFSHDLFDDYNTLILKISQWQSLQETQIKALISDKTNRNETTLPSVCDNYNDNKRCRGRCPDLHVCHEYIEGICEKSFCLKQHTLNDCSNILREYSLNDITIDELIKLKLSGIGLHIGYLNVRGLKKKKDEHGYIFKNIVNKYEIFCVVETLLSDFDTQDVALKEYSFNHKHRKKCTNISGGIGVYVHSKLCNYTKINTDTECDYIIWLTLDKQYLSLDSDLVVGVVYIPPSRSKYFNKYQLDILKSDIERKRKQYEYCLLIGDFNARTGSIPYSITNTRLAYTNVPLKRKSKDNTLNKEGETILDICKDNNIFIVNGRVGHDREHGGCFTKDKSVLEYAIASIKCFELFADFTISDAGSLSDGHKLLSLSFKKNYG